MRCTQKTISEVVSLLCELDSMPDELDSPSAQALSKLLADQKTLDLSSQFKRGYTSPHCIYMIKKLIHVLASNTSIRTLILSNNGLKDLYEKVPSLFKELTSNKTLTNIDLRDNDYTSTDLMFIKKLCHRNKAAQQKEQKYIHTSLKTIDDFFQTSPHYLPKPVSDLIGAYLFPSKNKKRHKPTSNSSQASHKKIRSKKR